MLRCALRPPISWKIKLQSPKRGVRDLRIDSVKSPRPPCQAQCFEVAADVEVSITSNSRLGYTVGVLHGLGMMMICAINLQASCATVQTPCMGRVSEASG